MKKFKYQWRQVTRCKENSHIMPALKEFGGDGWEVFQVETMVDKDGGYFYGVWMRREVDEPPPTPTDEWRRAVEACARIAEQYVNNSGIMGGPFPDIKKEIAAQIRALSPTKPDNALDTKTALGNGDCK